MFLLGFQSYCTQATPLGFHAHCAQGFHFDFDLHLLVGFGLGLGDYLRLQDGFDLAFGDLPKVHENHGLIFGDCPHVEGFQDRFYWLVGPALDVELQAHRFEHHHVDHRKHRLEDQQKDACVLDPPSLLFQDLAVEALEVENAFHHHDVLFDHHLRDLSLPRCLRHQKGQDPFKKISLGGLHHQEGRENCPRIFFSMHFTTKRAEEFTVRNSCTSSLMRQALLHSFRRG